MKSEKRKVKSEKRKVKSEKFAAAIRLSGSKFFTFHSSLPSGLFRILFIDKQAEVGRDGVDVVHDIGQLVLVLHPRLFV